MKHNATVEIVYRYEGGDHPAPPRPANAQEALQRLSEGNRTFAALFSGVAERTGAARRIIPVDPYDLGLLNGQAGALRQRPFAAVLGCADARVPIELIFNEGPNDLFVVRVAGNTLGDDVRGSLSYALEHLAESLKLVVVLGHSGCGAVSAAVDVFLNPAAYLSLAANHSVRSVVDRLGTVVHASARTLANSYGDAITRHPRYREALIECAVITNAALGAHTLQSEIGNEDSAVQVRYGVYNLADRSIWAPRHDSAAVVGLAAPPTDRQGFAAFGQSVLASARVQAILES